MKSRTFTLVATASLFAFSNIAFADECESIINASRVYTKYSFSEAEVKSQADNFCSSYQRHVDSGSNFNAEASYKFFSGGVGVSNKTLDEVASSICSSTNRYQASESALQYYAESIAPGAFDAYKQCKLLSTRNLSFIVDRASVLPKEIVIEVAYNKESTTATTARVRYSASQGVSCRWNESGNNPVSIPSAGQAQLKCRRDFNDKKSSISIDRMDGGGHLAFPWGVYSPEGIPVDIVSSLDKRISEVEKIRVESGVIQITQEAGSRPLNDGSQCPTGADATRGIRHGRIVFGQQYSSPPKVVLSINSIDIGGVSALDAHRLGAYVSRVDERGFEYQFYTWCTTIVSGAQASWIAVGR